MAEFDKPIDVAEAIKQATGDGSAEEGIPQTEPEQGELVSEELGENESVQGPSSITAEDIVAKAESLREAKARADDLAAVAEDMRRKREEAAAEKLRKKNELIQRKLMEEEKAREEEIARENQLKAEKFAKAQEEAVRLREAREFESRRQNQAWTVPEAPPSLVMDGEFDEYGNDLTESQSFKTMSNAVIQMVHDADDDCKAYIATLQSIINASNIKSSMETFEVAMNALRDCTDEYILQRILGVSINQVCRSATYLGSWKELHTTVFRFLSSPCDPVKKFCEKYTPQAFCRMSFTDDKNWALHHRLAVESFAGLGPRTPFSVLTARLDNEGVATCNMSIPPSANDCMAELSEMLNPSRPITEGTGDNSRLAARAAMSYQTGEWMMPNAGCDTPIQGLILLRAVLRIPTLREEEKEQLRDRISTIEQGSNGTNSTKKANHYTRYCLLYLKLALEWAGCKSSADVREFCNQLIIVSLKGYLSSNVDTKPKGKYKRSTPEKEKLRIDTELSKRITIVKGSNERVAKALDILILFSKIGLPSSENAMEQMRGTHPAYYSGKRFNSDIAFIGYECTPAKAMTCEAIQIISGAQELESFSCVIPQCLMLYAQAKRTGDRLTRKYREKFDDIVSLAEQVAVIMARSKQRLCLSPQCVLPSSLHAVSRYKTAWTVTLGSAPLLSVTDVDSGALFSMSFRDHVRECIESVADLPM